MILAFEYPVTRDYPWRFTTLSIFASSLVMIGSLAYLNVATIGMTTYTSYSSVFTEWKEPNRIDRLNVRAMNNFTIGCESATLVAGGTYRTENGAFTYTIQSLYDKASQKCISNAYYNGTSLETCTVGTITASGSFSTYEATFEATVNCSFPGDLEVVVTANTLSKVPFRGSTENVDSRLSPLARSASRLLKGVSSDYFYEVVLTAGQLNTTGVMRRLTSFGFIFQINNNSTIDWLDGSTFISETYVNRNPSKLELKEATRSQSVEAFENYIQVLSSSILSDLGITSKPNVMTDCDLFKRVIQPIDFTYRTNMGTSSGNISQVNMVLGDMSNYSFPFASVQPTQFNAQYLCHYQAWKPRTNLITDVLVATVSLFTVFWGALKLALDFFARRASTDGNHCTCVNCHSVQGAIHAGGFTRDEKDSSYSRVSTEEQ
ncbi:hypothetical protein BDV93DRAFT_66240 [Ceratobasidium sp. AG-I]|nr:hypothetical protein BDV93DRAFT_66240 [Ceratobasidium sp. AG-I]